MKLICMYINKLNQRGPTASLKLKATCSSPHLDHVPEFGVPLKDVLDLLGSEVLVVQCDQAGEGNLVALGQDVGGVGKPVVAGDQSVARFSNYRQRVDSKLEANKKLKKSRLFGSFSVESFHTSYFDTKSSGILKRTSFNLVPSPSPL